MDTEDEEMETGIELHTEEGCELQIQISPDDLASHDASDGYVFVNKLFPSYILIFNHRTVCWPLS